MSEQRFLTIHRVNPANRQLDVELLGELDEYGGALGYLISGPMSDPVELWFRAGPKEGITNEALMAILIHRLETFADRTDTLSEQARLSLENVVGALRLWLENNRIYAASKGRRGE